MEKDQGTQHVLFQDHGGIWDKISHGSLILFAFYRECHKKKLSTGVVQKKSYQRSNRSIKTRMFYTAGNGANGRWVVEEATSPTSIQQEGYRY
jgi:hypothetical protein